MREVEVMETYISLHSIMLLQTVSRFQSGCLGVLVLNEEEFRIPASLVNQPLPPPPLESNAGLLRLERQSTSDLTFPNPPYHDTFDTRAALSPTTFGAGRGIGLPTPLELSPVVDASPRSTYSNKSAKHPADSSDLLLHLSYPSQRFSAVPSFVHEFPDPPEQASPTMIEEAAMGEGKSVTHSMAFGQVVTGPPGAGKSTYCHGMHQVSPNAQQGAFR